MAPMNLDTITTEQTAQASSGSRHFCVSYVIFQRRRSPSSRALGSVVDIKSVEHLGIHNKC
ncbi:hypothetical protein CUMW_080270 [Citrus unshiu]|uniref:Uncharacterized protein n=1 Tax=Citrus unshiu TaxID=55188 RepID=A0A2H5NVP8_CITUN|nr:hypothetical protein CUMW_080270 [Citrus unshiu]